MTYRKLIYHPSGKAGEYANKGYAANLFKGCTHGCQYCYVPQFSHLDKASFHSSVTTAPNVLERLAADMKRIGVVPEPIFLCFTCDPYCVYADTSITRRAIEIILKSGNKVNMLTKAGMKATRDLDLLSSENGNKLGATLTFKSAAHSVNWEQRAAWPTSRITMLRLAKELGIETWASIEPVIIPEESLAIMEAAMPYVDEFKIGKWNHDPRAKAINWEKFALDAKALMEAHGKRFMFKRELLEELN